jgi:asparagine synthase (glutamine-hydrolysing)
MCGIAGIFRLEGTVGADDRAAVERMTGAQRHRGPDDCGLYHDERAALGHRRLSIIDVSTAGHQPMANETKDVWVIYNGEIYNFQELRRELASAGHNFQSHSDTEVLIHGYEEWGEDGLLRRLRGMFTFAIYDAARSRLVLARDRLGIKPLYYFVEPKSEGIAFASEVKALLASGMISNQTNREALAGFLLFGSIPAPSTVVQGVQCLLPGHYLVAEPTGVRTKRYWDFDFAASNPAAAAQLGGVLRDAVERHLVSDVPLGIFLSAGVDSSGLVALARPCQERLKTLTISFAEQEFDEAALARQVAERFKTEHHELRVSGADFVREFPKILAAMDQPTNDGVNTYFVAKLAREAGLTVVLSGLGGDELFWGYSHYRWMARNRRVMRMFAQAPRVMRNAMVGGAAAYGRVRGKEAWMRLNGLGAGMSAEGLYLALRGFFAPEQVQRLLGAGQSEMEQLLSENLAILRPATTNGDYASGMNYVEMKRYLHDQLLRDTDVFSMAHSVEVRVPYLDDAVVAAASSVPSASKTNATFNKPALVHAIGDSLVAEASRRPKRGFSFPMAKWIREQSGSMRELALETSVLDRGAVTKLWSAFERGHLHWSRAWSLAVLGARG